MTPTSEFLAAALAGLGTGLVLIVAIGVQNAVVLREGIRGEYVGMVVLVCLFSDVVLIWTGVAGVGEMVHAMPAAATVAKVGGAGYLLTYAALTARRSLRVGTALPSNTGANSTRRMALAGILAATWLNPNVYLDVLLLGSLASVHGELRWGFGVGAISASALWFIALGYGAALLRPIFTRPRAWQVMDALTAVVMTALGIALATRA
ncbi:LysE/ArgO family amino acid transporter [Arthrobacter sp.]|uniref:LysE/ArgO family amino acid transporter n=1 Tax=Arthrobacter sp. TaxID=1667 RepID=UPI0026DF5239|nr:LysE family transporter [Arthrobacter sp.]MDO5753434.1 LysE family transporter [Arthrobacter sp.]